MDKNYNKIFGFNMKIRRKAKRITQKQMGEQLDLSQEIISDYEIGKKIISLNTATKISKILKCSLDDLLKEV